MTDEQLPTYYPTYSHEALYYAL